MWNYSYEIPAVFLLFIVSAAYYALPRVPADKNKCFSTVIAICALTEFFNVFSAWIDDNPGRAPLAAVCFFNSGVYMMLVLRALVMLWFFLMLTDLVEFSYVKILYGLGFALTVFVSYTNILSGYYFLLDEDGIHFLPEYAQHDVILMAVCAFMMIAAFVGKKNLKHSQFHCLVFAAATDAVAIYFDFMYPYILLSDMMYGIILLLIYLSFLNPAFFIHPDTGVFNEEGMKMILKSRGWEKKGICAFSIKNYLVLRELVSTEAIASVMDQVGKMLREMKGVSACYAGEARYVLFVERKENVDPLLEDLRDRFRDRWKYELTDIYCDAAFLKVETDSMSGDPRKVNFTVEHVLSKTEKDQVTVVDDMLIGRIRYQNRVNEILSDRIKADDVKMFLQPIVDAQTGKIAGAEALARLYDEELGYIPPAEFIPEAEESGLITQLGEQMFRKACSFMENESVPGLQWINVNVSPSQFADVALSEEFQKIADRVGVPKEEMHLEITETAFTSGASLEERTQAFVARHFRMVLDDFGSGYSNFSRVVNCPFTNIKLDMNFVWSCMKNKREVLKEMIHVFHSMGFTVTAEGIENAEMADTLRGYGCDYFQGFYYSKPLLVDEFVVKYGKRDF